ncbi:MAG: single-stranded DNA-binding protein [Defluviitaleaceae bacterium]|nr:single-stranded DNA-binding protein [Defluviitaleaceae bacterium]
MPQENIQDNNLASVYGQIASDFVYSHEVYGEAFLNFYLEIFRLSETSDILPVTISERLLSAEKYEIGTFVHITGQIRSYNSYVEADRKNKLVLTVFARDMVICGGDAGVNPNEIFLNGFICKPPIYRMTPFGREIADVLLAVNRSYNKSDYIPCIAWGRNARFAGRLAVSDNIRIFGRMQSRTYQKHLDEERVVDKVAYEVSVSKIELARDLFDSAP